MARKAIQYYIFTPGAGGAGTVKIADNYQLKDILMITNVTTNTVIYNFSDSTRGGTISYSSTDTTTIPGAQNGVTTLTLDLDTSAMSANDKLQIFVETVELRVRTHDFGIDAVERQRMALPESLIDADFEYGLQQTKWASFTAGFQTSMTYEVPGTDVQANVFGYATLMTAGSSGNISSPGAGASATSFRLVNQGFTPAVTTTNFPLGFAISYQGNTGPTHNLFDYKIIINQPLGASAPRGSTWVANSATTAGARSVTLANGGPAQKSFTVISTQYWNAGDIGVLVTLPDNDVATVGTAAVTAGGFNLQTNVALSAQQCQLLAIETSTGGQFELVSVNANPGTNNMGITRGVLGTNSDTVLTLPLGARIKSITSNGALGTSASAFGYVGNIELFRVDAVDSSTNVLHVTRGWMNTNASPIVNPGSIVAKVNMASELSPLLGGASNIEIVRSTAVSTLQDGQLTVTRSQLGTTALSGAPAGSLVITAAGVFVAGNTSVPVIGVNANAHGVGSAVRGASPFGGSDAVAGHANIANAFVSTLGLNNANVEGIYFNTINDVNYMAFYPKVAPNRDIGYMLNSPVTSNDIVVRKGGLYSGANIQFASIVSNVGNPSTMTVTTVQPHGLYPGMILQTALHGSQNANTHASGIFVINSVPHTNQFTFVAKSGAIVANALATVAAIGQQSQINGNLTLFPTSLVRHRPVDGGTNIGVNSPSYGYEVARQTKKYFRYQSGKGMMFTTGISMCPVFTVTNVAAAGTSVSSAITILTELEHGLQVGANISLFGITTTGYNDYYTVASIVNPTAFTVAAKNILGATSPTYGTFPKFSVLNWHGARVRVGMFDDQNGVYWEYDGIKVKVGRRSATREVLGRVNVGINQHLVAGDRFCRFVDQLDVGDQIVIRGQNHTVSRVVGQSEMYITPTYRGSVNAAEARMSVIDTLLVPQDQFNLDKLDGTGPSGYVLDKSKMQMVAIQYTWYGAGFIDWGLRTTDGKMIWAHRVKNNNVNDEAFMRSGNLPARYMTSNRTNALSRLALPLVAAETGNISLQNITDFPVASASIPVTVVVDDELITYAAGPFAANGNVCTLTRSAVISNFNLGQVRSMSMGLTPQGSGVSHSADATCRLFSITASPDLNHWGSAVILDGRFDIDRSYQFTYNLANLNVLGTQVQTLFMMRLAPAITNAVTGELGSKDLINRAQLLLQNMFVNIADTAATLKPRFLLQAVLNPTNIISANWQPLNVRFNQPGGTLQTGGFNQPSFTQFVANVYPAGDKPTNLWGVNSVVFDLSPRGHHNGLPYAQGGEQLFSIPVSATNSGFIDLKNVKEIGGAVLPGTGFYPNGNEIVAFNIVPAQGAQANVDVQVTYIESQA
jgi:hypothetical protein